LLYFLLQCESISSRLLPWQLPWQRLLVRDRWLFIRITEGHWRNAQWSVARTRHDATAAHVINGILGCITFGFGFGLACQLWYYEYWRSASVHIQHTFIGLLWTYEHVHINIWY